VARRLPEARLQFDQILERDPTFIPASFYGSQVDAAMGRWADAVIELNRTRLATQAGTSSPDAEGYLNLITSIGDVPPTNVAVAYALAGNPKKAMDELEVAYDQQDSELMACIRFPAFDSLKSDPRWAALLQKLGLPL
jgi:hypothetical protein